MGSAPAQTYRAKLSDNNVNSQGIARTLARVLRIALE